MNPQPLVIFGAGGHAREAAQLVRDINEAAPAGPIWHLLGCLADQGVSARHDASLPVLGDAAWLARHPDTALVIAVGASSGRQQVATRLAPLQPRFATLVHPRAWVAADVAIGLGSVVFAGTYLNTGVRLGAHVHINLGCTVSHDSELGDFVSLGPGVHLAGGVQLGPGCDVGVGSCFRPGVAVASSCVIGAGAAVVADLPESCVAVGVPARPRA
jgi:sugar O-acyltransferase (sialic acid O-acetyltransferase NeuD family)